jgi:RNA polymerase sigma-70 factor (ECF subfamily)
MDTQRPPDDRRESQLIRRAAGGDRQAWAELLDAHRPRLRRMVALRLHPRLRGRIDPSDVIQEAYLDATAGLADYAARAEMPFFLWLRWLTGMRLTTLQRKHLGCRIRDAAREVPIDRGAAPQATSAALAAQLLGRQTSASEVAMRLERKARLQEAIEAMDPLDREVLVLRHFEELTNAEAARTLDLQESAASKRYIRALRRLQEALSAMPGGSAEYRP